MDVRNTKLLYNLYSDGNYKVSVYAETDTEAYNFARNLNFMLFKLKFIEEENETIEDLYDGYQDFDWILAEKDDIDRQDLNILN
jgi:hypothetical protein